MDKRPFLASSRFLLPLALLLLFGLGLAIRLYDLTDLPLDFHPTRQLFSAVKARGMYYQSRWDLPNWQRTMAIQQWKSKVTVEPEIMEHLAAFTYRYTGEKLWLPRLYSALFWLAGGVFLYLLARRLASTGGALLALAFYLFTPYGVYASRSFQPDPLMVTLALAFWWLVVRWAASPYVLRFTFRVPRSTFEEIAPGEKKGARTSWLFAILAGLVGGLAIYVKLTAAFFVIGGALGAALGRFRTRDLLRDPHVWVMAALGALPGLSWALSSGLASNYLGEEVNSRFVPALLASPLFYLGWQNKMTAVVGGLGAALALLGLFFVRERRARAFLAGLWIAYLSFGLYFNYHISTHDYYSLPLIPIVALSLAGMGERFFAWVVDDAPGTGASRGAAWRRGALAVVLIYGLLSVVWSVRNEMKAVDYRPQQAWWEEIGAALGREASVVALSPDYGLQLAYWGWVDAAVWPSSGDAYRAQALGGGRDFEAFFEKMAGKKRFFLVADMDDFARQPELRSLLAGYAVYAQGEGYVIYDLQRPLEAQP
ncbi:MAG: ArnT family glycosyltransferase [Chloroflexota bacterium]